MSLSKPLQIANLIIIICILIYKSYSQTVHLFSIEYLASGIKHISGCTCLTGGLIDWHKCHRKASNDGTTRLHVRHQEITILP